MKQISSSMFFFFLITLLILPTSSSAAQAVECPSGRLLSRLPLLKRNPKWKKVLRSQLLRAINRMKTNPMRKFQVNVHTNNRGSGRFNKSFSQRRAQTIRTFMIQLGASRSQLSANGYGEDCLLAKGSSRNIHKKNSRVDINFSSGQSVVRARSAIILLPTIYFSDGSMGLTAKARQILKQVKKLMLQFPQKTLSIQGHRASLERIDKRARIDEIRAQIVQTKLQQMGISKRRLRIKAMADHFPIATNRTAAGRSRNRRVQFTLR